MSFSTPSISPAQDVIMPPIQALSSNSPKANTTECSVEVEEPVFSIKSLDHLQLPTLSVSGTPASWISRSKLVKNSMVFQNDGDSSCDEAASSLGDSSYDFLDDRSAFTDDEERDLMAESTSSESLEAQRQSPHTPQNSRPNSSPLSLTIQTTCGTRYGNVNSLQNATEEECLAEDPDEPIQFEEPSVVNINTSRMTEVFYALRSIHDPYQVNDELQKASKALPEGKYNITVRQTMASQSIELKGRPYKVLIIGDDPATTLVVQKIAAALASSQKHSKADSGDASPTKFSIVPISGFGDSKHPEVVLIDSSRLEMSVEYCHAAAYVSTKESKDILNLRMADGGRVQSCWSQSEARYVYSKDWELPDLAILFTSAEEDALASMTRGVAHSFMYRHGVPSIVIQKKAMWVKPTTLDYLTPHLCLESQQSHSQNAINKIRFPIDLSTFLSIDEGQLNRNLACLAQSRRPMKPQPCSSTKGSESRGKAWYSETSKVFSQTLECVYKEYEPKVLRFFGNLAPQIIALVVFGTLFGCMIGFAAFGAAPKNNTMSARMNLSTTGEMTQFAPSSTFTPVISELASSTSQKLPTKSLSSNTEIAAFLLDAYALGPDKSDEFLVQLLGDRHIVVNTPRWMHQSKRAPALLFEVSRQNKSIEYTSSKIGEGVYALQVPYEEAYGILNLSMTIQSKPVKRKNFDVDFGSSWLQKAAWKRVSRVVSDAVLKDLSIVQSSLSTVYNHSLTELSTFVHQTKHTLVAQKKVKHAMLASHLKWRSHTRALMLSQSKELSRHVSRIRVGRMQVTQQIKSLKKDFTRSVSVYTSRRIQALSHHADVYNQMLHRIKVDRQTIAAEYLKTAQKKALRAWWKVVGVPKTSRLRKVVGGDAPQTPPDDRPRIFDCF